MADETPPGTVGGGEGIDAQGFSFYLGAEDALSETLKNVDSAFAKTTDRMIQGAEKLTAHLDTHSTQQQKLFEKSAKAFQSTVELVGTSTKRVSTSTAADAKKFVSEIAGLETPRTFREIETQGSAMALVLGEAFLRNEKDGRAWVRANEEVIRKVLADYAFFGREAPKAIQQAGAGFKTPPGMLPGGGAPPGGVPGIGGFFGTVEEYIKRIKGISVGATALGGLAFAAAKKLRDAAEDTYKVGAEGAKLTMMTQEDIWRRYSEATSVKALTGAKTEELEKISVAFAKFKIIPTSFKEGAKAAFELHEATGMLIEDAATMTANFQNYYDLQGKALDQQVGHATALSKLTQLDIKQQAELYDRLKYVGFELNANAETTKNIATSTINAAAAMAKYGVSTESAVKDLTSITEGGLGEYQQNIQSLVLGGASPEEAMRMLDDVVNGVKGALEKVTAVKNQAAENMFGLGRGLPHAAMGQALGVELATTQLQLPGGEGGRRAAVARGGLEKTPQAEAAKELMEGGEKAAVHIENAMKEFLTASENWERGQEKLMAPLIESQKGVYEVLLRASEEFNKGAGKLAEAVGKLDPLTMSLIGFGIQLGANLLSFRMILPQLAKLLGVGKAAGAVGEVAAGATGAAGAGAGAAGVAGVASVTAVVGTVLAGAAIGGILGTLINKYILPESWKTKIGDLLLGKEAAEGLSQGTAVMGEGKRTFTEEELKASHAARAARKAPAVTTETEKFLTETKAAAPVKPAVPSNVVSMEEYRKEKAATALPKPVSTAKTLAPIEALAAASKFSETSTTGGAHVPGSLHPEGRAADFSVKGKSEKQIETFIADALRAGATKAVYETKPPAALKDKSQWAPHIHVEVAEARKAVPETTMAAKTTTAAPVVAAIAKFPEPFKGKTQGDEQIISELRQANALLAQTLAALQKRTGHTAPIYTHEGDTVNQMQGG